MDAIRQAGGGFKGGGKEEVYRHSSKDMGVGFSVVPPIKEE